VFRQRGRSLSEPTKAFGNGPGPQKGGSAPAVRLRIVHGTMNRIASAALAVFLLAGSRAPAVAGHGVSHVPSYYPHEIRIDAVEPAAAADGLGNKTLHAYIGAMPGFGGRVPDHVKPVESLGSFLVLGFNPASETFASGESRCTAARGILAALRERAPGFVFHPYPVTPYHADYLHHLDRIEETRAALGAQTGATKPLKFRAKGRHAQAIVRSRWTLASKGWDVSLEEVPVDALIADARVQLNGWLGPPWVKEGWFQAYRLLASAVAGAENRRTVDETHGRLMRGEYLDLAERVNLERRLVAALTRGCARMVVGYTLRREYYNDDFSAGVENIAYDSQLGLNSPVFVRTAKLKDFPWNGSLHLGMAGRPEAAWNPVAGFTDPAGRLIWSMVGDPALVPFPSSASWIPNRFEFTVTAARGQSGGVKVPADAVRPEPGTGALRPVGRWTFASVKVVYKFLASPFQDGTETEVADLLYPFVLAYRWGAKAGPDDQAYDPGLDAALATMRGRLMGVRAVRVERTVKAIAPGFDVIQKTPVIEVYLRDAPGDEHQVAALAPPWSTVPWHLLVLMEEAVLRGHAAFSKEEAERRGVGWLDLVRDRPLQAKLKALIGELERQRYRPDALKDLVTAEAAGLRWRALRTFAEEKGHLLVTNGPYRLTEWRPDSVVLQAVREATYPLGFGTFDRYVHPPRAVIREVTRETGRIVVRADAEKTVKVQRSYKTVLEPLTRKTTRGLYGILVDSRYLLVGADGAVVGAGKMRWEEDGRFVVDLPERMSPGRYTVLLAIYLDGNSLTPSAKALRFQVRTR